MHTFTNSFCVQISHNYTCTMYMYVHAHIYMYMNVGKLSFNSCESIQRPTSTTQYIPCNGIWLVSSLIYLIRCIYMYMYMYMHNREKRLIKSYLKIFERKIITKAYIYSAWEH